MSKQSKQPKPLSETELQYSAEVIENFVRYLSSPWRIIWTNLVAGILRGLGAVIGATVVIAAMIWLLSLFVNVPLIGKYAEQVGNKINQYVDETNYNQEFDRLGDSLERIESSLSIAPMVLAPGQAKIINDSDSRVVSAPAGQPNQAQ